MGALLSPLELPPAGHPRTLTRLPPTCPSRDGPARERRTPPSPLPLHPIRRDPCGAAPRAVARRRTQLWSGWEAAPVPASRSGRAPARDGARAAAAARLPPPGLRFPARPGLGARLQAREADRQGGDPGTPTSRRRVQAGPGGDAGGTGFARTILSVAESVCVQLGCRLCPGFVCVCVLCVSASLGVWRWSGRLVCGGPAVALCGWNRYLAGCALSVSCVSRGVGVLSPSV